MRDDLRETAVHAALSTKWMGRSYRYFAQIGSTNDALKEAAADPQLPAGTVFLTDFQSQGRGRLQRRWLAPAGSSLLLSILFRPEWPPEQAQWLTMLVSTAAAEAVEAASGLPVGIKWPNDLLIEVDGVWHKFSGMLLEGQMGENGRFQSAVLGIGINVNIPVESLPEAVTPATSLRVAAGRSFSRLDLLADFLYRLEIAYQTAENGRSPQSAWQQRLVTLGKQVRVTQGQSGQPIVGEAVGSDEWGRLLVRDEAGQLHTIAAGDVTLR
jgi:BirA family biotin operon repressor/biotin-[acetyl-CoA-carboxylase] ligase